MWYNTTPEPTPQNMTAFEMEEWYNTYGFHTILYVLKLDNIMGNIDSLMLIEEVLDMDCPGDDRVHIDITDYEEGIYIIAIGGRYQQTGEYFLQLQCTQYSFPMKEDEFQPNITAPTLPCNKQVVGGTIHNNQVAYF